MRGACCFYHSTHRRWHAYSVKYWLKRAAERVSWGVDHPPCPIDSSDSSYPTWALLPLAYSIYIYSIYSIYIIYYICSPPHDLPQWSPMKVLPYLSPWPTFDHDARPFWCSLLIKRLMSLWRCRNKHWQDGKKQVFKAFDLQKNVVTRKCCLQVTICIEDKLSLKQETLFLQENYHVWKDAIQALMKLILPVSPLVWQWFSAFLMR